MLLLQIRNSGILQGALRCALMHFDQGEWEAGFTRGSEWGKGEGFRQGDLSVYVNGLRREKGNAVWAGCHHPVTWSFRGGARRQKQVNTC